MVTYSELIQNGIIAADILALFVQANKKVTVRPTQPAVTSETRLGANRLPVALLIL